MNLINLLCINYDVGLLLVISLLPIGFFFYVIIQINLRTRGDKTFLLNNKQIHS